MIPAVARLYDVIGATWPAAHVREEGPFTLRDGQGGGKRVSAATARKPVTADKLPAAEAAMRDMGQDSLFMIREGDEALDTLLAARGYAIVDPVNIYAAPVALLARPTPRVSTYTIWEPLAIQCDIWQAGGIGPERLAVMRRVRGPRTSLFGRHANHPAATGFCAIHDGIAMVHALEVHALHRRQNMGRLLMHQAALWAARQGAIHVAAVCTRANGAADALYASLGMALVGQYHYRQKVRS